MGLFYARFGEDGARYIPGTGREKRKKRAAVVVVRLGFCFGVCGWVWIINNKGVALYGLRLAGLWLPRFGLVYWSFKEMPRASATRLIYAISSASLLFRISSRRAAAGEAARAFIMRFCVAFWVIL